MPEWNPGFTNLIGFFEFSEPPGSSAIDSHGNLPNLTDVGTVARTTGKVGNAASIIDGASEDHFLNDTTPSDLIFGDNSFTIAQWIYVNTAPGLGTYTNLFSSGQVAGGGYQTRFYSTKAQFLLHKATVGSHTHEITIGTGKWVFLVHIYDKVNNRTRIWTDNSGSLVVNNSTLSITPTAQSSGEDLRVGVGDNNPTSDIDIDQIAVYGRALDDDEVAWLWNSGSGRAYSDLPGTMTNPETTNLRSWWTLDEQSGQRVDSHGDNDMQDYNTVGYTTGKQGNAADFSNPTNNEYLEAGPTTTGLNVASGQSFSVGVWIYPRLVTPGGFQVINAGGTGSGNMDWYLMVWQDQAYFTVRQADDAGWRSVAYPYIQANQWSFVVAWYDAANNKLGIQMNNLNPLFTTSVPTLGLDGNRQAMMGQNYSHDSWERYDGLIDEAFFYDRVLTDAERNYLYDWGSGRSYSDVMVLDPVDIKAAPVVGSPGVLPQLPFPVITPGGLEVIKTPVYVLNKSLSVVGIIDEYYSLIWAERYNEAGDFEMELPIEFAASSLMTFGYFLKIAQSDKLMFIEDLKPQTSEEKTVLVVKGRSAEAILVRRVLTDPVNVDGVAETIIYTLMADNVTNPTDTDRDITLFKNTFPTVTTTVTLAEQINMDTIYEIISSICKATALGFKVEKEGTLLAFSVYEGKDRSFAQSTNPWVIFSDKFGNVIESSFYLSESEKVNVTLVATDDSVPALQRVFVWTETTEPSDLDRFEALLETTIPRDIDGDPLSDAEVGAIIATRGKALIEERKSVGFFEGDFDIKGNFQYGVHFFMGDIVQCNIEGRNVKARVVEMFRSFTTEGEKSYVAMDFIL